MGPGSRGPLLPQVPLSSHRRPTSQPPVDNREPHTSCGLSKTPGKSGSFQDSLHTPHCPLALSTQPSQCVGAGCGVCWATASNLSSDNAQRLDDTAGFDATARWGCNSHRPGAVSGCCDLLENAEVGPWPTTDHPQSSSTWAFPAACPGLDQVTLTSGDWNAKPRGLWHDHCPTLVRDMEETETQPPIVQRSIRCPSQNVSVAGETRPTAGHGGRSLERGAGVLDLCGRPELSSSSSSVLHELRLNQLSTLWRCTGAFVLTAIDAARSTPELAGPKPGKHSAADGGGGREECPWLAVALPQPSFQGRGVPLNKNPADANPGDDVAAATTCQCPSGDWPAGPRPMTGPKGLRRVSMTGESLQLDNTCHDPCHPHGPLFMTMTRVKLVGSSCKFMQVQDSAHTFGQRMQPSPRPYLQTNTRQLANPVGPASPIRTPQRRRAAQHWSPKVGGVVFPSLRSSCSSSCIAGPPGRIPLRRVLLCSTPHRLLGGRGHQVSSLTQRLPKSQHVGSTARAENGPTTTHTDHNKTLPHFLASGSIACPQAISAGLVCSVSCPGGLNATPCVTCHSGHGRYLRTDSHAAPIGETLALRCFFFVRRKNHSPSSHCRHVVEHREKERRQRQLPTFVFRWLVWRSTIGGARR